MSKQAGTLQLNSDDSRESLPPQSKDIVTDHYTYDAEQRKLRLANGASRKDILMILTAGIGLISDGYQNNVMTMLNKVFSDIYPKVYDSDMKASVSNSLFVGTIFGQIAVGVASDYIGRKWLIILATLFLIFGTIMCAASHGLTTKGMFWMLIVARGITGFGVGAEYPSSSVSALEAANESVKRRGGAFVLSTNLPLSFGGPFAMIVFLIVIQITKKHYEALWRSLFAIGAFFPLAIFYFRLKLASSELYRENAIKSKVPYWLALRYYWKRLLGTCLTWFLYDIITFPNGIFSATIIGNILGKKNTHNYVMIAEYNLLLGVIALPGVFGGAYLIDRIGRKYTIMIGFAGYILFGLIVGLAYDKLIKITPLFVILYGLLLSSGNLGPGDGMGLISSESFATPVRGTCYGISAAVGKVGAIVGVKSFQPIAHRWGNRYTFIVAAICGLLGIAATYFLVPHLNDDDLMEEDVKFKNYLRQNGWQGSFGESQALGEVEQVDDQDSFRKV